MINDKRILEALERSLEHSPPFTQAELDSVRIIRVYHCENPDELNALTAIDTLTLEHSRIPTLSALDLPTLASLNVHFSTLTELDGVHEFSKLFSLSLWGNRLRDLTPCLDHPSSWLQSISVGGNPLTRESREDIIPQLQDKGIYVDFDDEEIWQLNCRLAEKNVSLAAFRDSTNSNGLVLHRIGPKEEDTRGQWPLKMSIEALDAKLQRDEIEIQELILAFHQGDPFAEALRNIDDFNYAEHRTGHSADEMRNVVENTKELESHLQNALLRLVDDFPEGRFLRESNELLDHLEERHNVSLPDWFRTLRKTMSYVYKPELSMLTSILFQDSKADWLTNNKPFSLMSLGFDGADQRRLLSEQHGFFPIGFGGVEQEISLLIRTNHPTDHRIYGFTLEELTETKAPEPIPLFENAVKLFDSIRALAASDGTIVERRKKNK